MNYDSYVFYPLVITLLVLFARLCLKSIIKTDVKTALIEHDNIALGIYSAGFLLSSFIVITASIHATCFGSLTWNILYALGYGIIGILFSLFCAKILMNSILSSNYLEAIHGGSYTTAIVAASAFVAVSMIYSGAVSEDITGAHIPALVFFAVGIFAFLSITHFFRLLTKYDDIKEILSGNLAAALGYSALIIAVGLIVGHAVSGAFYDWTTSFLEFADALAQIALLYPIRQFVVQGIFLGGGFHLYGGRLDDEVEKDKNIAAGIIEAATYLGAALIAIKLM